MPYKYPLKRQFVDVVTKGADPTGTADSSSAIQAAIDEVDSDGGKVLIPAGTYLCGTAFTLYDNVVIEGEGEDTIIKLTADITPFNADSVSNCHVKNMAIEVTDGHTESILEVSDTSGNADNNIFENIHILNPYTTHDYVGIRIHHTTANHIYRNRFSNIDIGKIGDANPAYGCDTAIHIDIDTADGWANGQIFENINVWRFKRIVDFDRIGGAAPSRSYTFREIHAEASPYSDIAFNIDDNRHTFDNCYVYDWDHFSWQEDDETTQDAGSYDATSDNNRITLDSGGMTIDEHIGRVFHFDNTSEGREQDNFYTITDNGPDWIEIDATLIASETVSQWHISTVAQAIFQVGSGAVYTLIQSSIAKYKYVVNNGTNTQIVTPTLHTIQHEKLVTVGRGLDYETLADACSDISPNANSPYIIIVVGKVYETSQIVPPQYCEIVGIGAEIISYVDDDTIDLNNNNIILRYLSVTKRGTATTAGAVLYIRNVDNTVKIHDCVFDNQASGNTNLAGVQFGNTVEAEFHNCFAYGGDGGINCHGWRFSATTEVNVVMNNCFGRGGNSGGDGIYCSAYGSAIITNSRFQQGLTSNEYGVHILNNFQAKLSNCTIEPQNHSSSFSYDSADNGRFQPFANHPYQLVGISVYVNNATVGETIDIGTSIGGNEVASGISIGSTGLKSFDFTRVEVASAGYLYATPSVAINNGDVTISYKVAYNYADAYGMLINTNGYVEVHNCSIQANGASDSLYLGTNCVNSGNFQIANTTIETLDETNQNAITAQSALSDAAKYIQNCALIGTINNLNLYSENVTATSEGVAASLYTEVTFITTNGDQDLDNITLADGLYAGQVKEFSVIAEGHADDTIKVTPSNLNGGTQITFSATPVGEGCILLFDGTNWNIIANNGGTIG